MPVIAVNRHYDNGHIIIDNGHTITDNGHAITDNGHTLVLKAEKPFDYSQIKYVLK